LTLALRRAQYHVQSNRVKLYGHERAAGFPVWRAVPATVGSGEELQLEDVRGLVDTLKELGEERRRILVNLKHAYEQRDLENVLKHVAEIVGLSDRADAGKSFEKSN
jgi:hypothetical protein